MTTAIQGTEEHAIEIPPMVTQGESSRKRPATFHVMGMASSSDERIPEATLKVRLMIDSKSREIACLRELVIWLHCEAKHHQNMSDFYQGEVISVKETLTSVKRKVVRIARLICFGE
ncbi:hypothetical protein AMTR_s00201p00025750 [Amborella trichopoda]|uniref:Uncharacterized protein n=1 Tax=Amborella trichopoda TaxID=13333 RepID=W1NMM3_AMBTC|nr:hypothetical protein AMTR_s00201p00025750 [Amborella trichopoda]